MTNPAGQASSATTAASFSTMTVSVVLDSSQTALRPLTSQPDIAWCERTWNPWMALAHCRR